MSAKCAETRNLNNSDDKDHSTLLTKENFDSFSKENINQKNIKCKYYKYIYIYIYNMSFKFNN